MNFDEIASHASENVRDAARRTSYRELGAEPDRKAVRRPRAGIVVSAAFLITLVVIGSVVALTRPITPRIPTTVATVQPTLPNDLIPPSEAIPATSPVGGTPEETEGVEGLESLSGYELAFDDGDVGLVVLTPGRRTLTIRKLPGQIDGTKRTPLMPVDESLIVGSGEISAVSLDSGTMTPLGRGTWYAPAPDESALWVGEDLVNSEDIVEWVVTLMNVDGTVLGGPYTLPQGHRPAAAVNNGLVLQTSDGIKVWRPDEGLGVVGYGDETATVLATTGENLAWCAGECTELHIENLSANETQIVFRQEGFLRVENGGTAQFSPDRQRLVVATNSSILVVVLPTGRALTLAEPSELPRRVSAAWSGDSSVLYWATRTIGERSTQISRYDVTNNETQSARINFAIEGPLVVVLDTGSGYWLTDGEGLPLCKNAEYSTTPADDCVIGL